MRTRLTIGTIFGILLILSASQDHPYANWPLASSPGKATRACANLRTAPGSVFQDYVFVIDANFPLGRPRNPAGDHKDYRQTHPLSVRYSLPQRPHIRKQRIRRCRRRDRVLARLHQRARRQRTRRYDRNSDASETGKRTARKTASRERSASKGAAPTRTAEPGTARPRAASTAASRKAPARRTPHPGAADIMAESLIRRSYSRPAVTWLHVV